MKKGFTLVEVMITCAIMAVIGLALVSVLKVGNDVWFSDSGLLDLQQQVRQVMDGVVREARQANPGQITITESNTKISFYIPDVSHPISYYLVNTDLTREHPAGTAKVISGKISAVDFCCVGGADCADCMNATILKIGIAASKDVRGRTISFPARTDPLVPVLMTEQVELRN